MNIDLNAPVISREKILINAAVKTVWNLFTDISNWSNWNADINFSNLAESLALGATFHWETAGMKIASTIKELIPPKQIGWSGEVQGIMGVHVWHFADENGITLVKTEESWNGEAARKNISEMQKTLDESLQSWLKKLKTEAEK